MSRGLNNVLPDEERRILLIRNIKKSHSMSEQLSIVKRFESGMGYWKSLPGKLMLWSMRMSNKRAGL